MNVVILDNYDSFTWNLAQLVSVLQGGNWPEVIRNDAIDLAGLRARRPDRIIISPGPGRPEDPAWFGVCDPAIRELGPTVPILGVCLGHLGIVAACGGHIVAAPAPWHGKTSEIHHAGRGLFSGLPAPFPAMRYHSLIGERDSLPDCLEATAWTADGLLMAVRHRELPLTGLQFHPESIGTPLGPQIVERFLKMG